MKTDDSARDPVGYKPLTFVLAWSIGTYLLYLFGPLNWQYSNLVPLTLLLLSSWTGTALGYLVGSRASVPSRPRRFNLDRLVVIGGILNIVTFPFALRAYTGLDVTQISFSMAQQGQVYADRYQYLIASSGTRTTIALLRGLAGPFIYGGLILGFRSWRGLSNAARMMLAASVIVQIAFSYARGTDKEIFDLAVFLIVGFLTQPKRFFARNPVKLMSILAIALTVVLLFGARREVRRGETLICNERAGACVDRDSSLVAPLIGERGYGILSEVTSYSTQGYYGLSLAFDLGFESSYGLGHAPVLGRVVDQVSGAQITSRSYQTRLLNLGWDPRYSWSTLYLYLANDVSFYGVPLFMALAGWMLGATWRSSVLNQDESAYVVFTMLILLFVYASANNQLAVSFESYFSFVAWTCMWGLRNRRHGGQTADHANSRGDLSASGVR